MNAERGARCAARADPAGPRGPSAGAAGPRCAGPSRTALISGRGSSTSAVALALQCGRNLFDSSHPPLGEGGADQWRSRCLGLRRVHDVEQSSSAQGRLEGAALGLLFANDSIRMTNLIVIGSLTLA